MHVKSLILILGIVIGAGLTAASSGLASPGGPKNSGFIEVQALLPSTSKVENGITVVVYDLKDMSGCQATGAIVQIRQAATTVKCDNHHYSFPAPTSSTVFDVVVPPR